VAFRRLVETRWAGKEAEVADLKKAVHGCFVFPRPGGGEPKRGQKRRKGSLRQAKPGEGG
jgi:hypothetical protein